MDGVDLETINIEQSTLLQEEEREVIQVSAVLGNRSLPILTPRSSQFTLIQ